ncbi:MAG: DUF1566 domain-containing protein [Alphaproteobacteria bacterium]
MGTNGGRRQEAIETAVRAGARATVSGRGGVRKATVAIAAMIAVVMGSTTSHAGLTKGRAIETGQQKSYGAVGDTTAGISRVYTDLGNGIVKDGRTGLFWEKKSDDGSVHDQDNIYSWSVGDPWGTSGSAFTMLITELNTPPCFGGYCDWRLPTVKELQTIVDFGRTDPATPVEFNKGCTPGCKVETCSCTRPGGYWSSSTINGSPAYGWGVNFSFGNDDYDYKPARSYVRAVRGGSVN